MDMESLVSLSDLGDMTALNHAAILHNLRVRFEHDQVFTALGPSVLLYTNPCKPLSSVFGPQVQERMRQTPEQPDETTPHIYQMAQRVLDEHFTTGASQAVLVQGQSLSGKTHATEAFMNYVTESSTVGAEQSIGDVLRQGITLLEDFGGAMIVHGSTSTSSSRVGKWVQMHFDTKSKQVASASVMPILFEKKRVVRRPHDQGNFAGECLLVDRRQWRCMYVCMYGPMHPHSRSTGLLYAVSRSIPLD
jgi:myosin-1